MESVSLKRNVFALRIPDGKRVELEEGSSVTIVHSQGENYSVETAWGFMARIEGEDADALGKEKKVYSPPKVDQDQGGLEKAVWDTLRTCYDPEIPLNIVDLGLVYSCQVQEESEGENKVEVEMTLTAPGCEMGDVLVAEVEKKVKELPGVKTVVLNLVWDPPWDQEMLSEAARLELGL